MVSRTVAVIVLLSAVTTAAETQNRPTPAHKPRPAPSEPCVEPVRALTPMGLASAYVEVLGHAGVAESLAVDALRGLQADSTNGQYTEASLADMLYGLDAARHEYRCAGQVLDPFRASRDSNVRSFAVETRGVFDAFTSWILQLTAQLRRRLSGGSLTVLAEADTIAALHKRRDYLTQLLALSSAGVSYLLVDTAETGRHARLALTTAQRDSVAAQLRTMSTSQFPDVATAASALLTWLTDPKWLAR
jgi:hypothetical protein